MGAPPRCEVGWLFPGIRSHRIVSCRAVPWVWIGLPGMVWYDNIIVSLVDGISLSSDGDWGHFFIYDILYFIFGLAQMGCPLHGFEVPTLLEGLLYW